MFILYMTRSSRDGVSEMHKGNAFMPMIYHI